jgi:hypothetical protein
MESLEKFTPYTSYRLHVGSPLVWRRRHSRSTIPGRMSGTQIFARIGATATAVLLVYAALYGAAGAYLAHEIWTTGILIAKE